MSTSRHSPSRARSRTTSSLTPRDVADLGRSSLVVYEKGFQPAVDDAVGSQVDEAKALDVATEVDLSIAATDDGHGHDHGEGDDHEEHGDEAAVDPHFWLDPTRYAKAVEAVAEKPGDGRPGRRDGIPSECRDDGRGA